MAEFLQISIVVTNRKCISIQKENFIYPKRILLLLPISGGRTSHMSMFLLPQRLYIEELLVALILMILILCMVSVKTV